MTGAPRRRFRPPAAVCRTFAALGVSFRCLPTRRTAGARHSKFLTRHDFRQFLLRAAGLDRIRCGA